MNVIKQYLMAVEQFKLANKIFDKEAEEFNKKMEMENNSLAYLFYYPFHEKHTFSIFTKLDGNRTEKEFDGVVFKINNELLNEDIFQFCKVIAKAIKKNKNLKLVKEQYQQTEEHLEIVNKKLKVLLKKDEHIKNNLVSITDPYFNNKISLSIFTDSSKPITKIDLNEVILFKIENELLNEDVLNFCKALAQKFKTFQQEIEETNEIYLKFFMSNGKAK